MSGAWPKYLNEAVQKSMEEPAAVYLSERQVREMAQRRAELLKSLLSLGIITVGGIMGAVGAWIEWGPGAALVYLGVLFAVVGVLIGLTD